MKSSKVKTSSPLSLSSSSSSSPSSAKTEVAVSTTASATFLNSAIANVLSYTAINYPSKYYNAFQNVSSAISNLSGRLSITVTSTNADLVYGAIGPALYKEMKLLLKYLETIPATPSTPGDVMEIAQLLENIKLEISFLRAYRSCSSVSSCGVDLTLVNHAIELLSLRLDEVVKLQ